MVKELDNIIENQDNSVHFNRYYFEGFIQKEDLEGVLDVLFSSVPEEKRTQIVHVEYEKNPYNGELQTKIVYQSVTPIWSSDDEENFNFFIAEHDGTHLGS